MKKTIPVTVTEPTPILPFPTTPVAPDLTPFIAALLSGGDNLGNGFTNGLFALASANGKTLDITQLLQDHNVPTHIRNRIVTTFRNNRRFSVGYVSPTLVSVK
jgi:hypothetical protein